MSAPHSSAHLNCWLKIELQSNCPLSRPAMPLLVQSQATKIRFKYFGIFHQFSDSVNMNSQREREWESACDAAAALLPAIQECAMPPISTRQPGSLAAVVQLCGKAFDQAISRPASHSSHFQSFMRQSVPATFPHVRLLNFPYAEHTLHPMKPRSISQICVCMYMCIMFPRRVKECKT